MRTLPLTLQTKVGRRVAGLFVLSALLPVVALAALGYWQVRQQLVEQSRGDLSGSAKSVGMGVLEQLREARRQLGEPGAATREAFASFQAGRRDGPNARWGAPPPAARLSATQSTSLDSGRVVLLLDGESPAVWMARGPGARRTWAELRPEFLFQGARARSVGESDELALCVRETAGRRTLYCDLDQADADDYLTLGWELFLGYDYDAAPWRVEVSRRRDLTLAPILSFRRTFLATIVAVLGLVVALTVMQVRRTLHPLQELRDGTGRLARRDFSRPVQVASGDEFQDLAASFNDMTVEIDRQFRSNTELIGRLDQLSYGALAALARTIDASSPWTAGHSERVTALALRMADRQGVAAAERDALRRGGLLHDIGKIGISPHILDKAGPLDGAELARIREHPALGARILAPLAAFADAIPAVLHHHERFDGTGYPHGLRGHAIPRLARLLAVADVYDALVSSRPYRPGWSREFALATIRSSSGSHFDPDMVEVFFQVIEETDASPYDSLLGASA